MLGFMKWLSALVVLLVAAVGGAIQHGLRRINSLW